MRELPKGWVMAAISDISDIILGQSPPSSSYNTAGTGLPFFQGKAEFGELHPVTARWSVAGAKRARLGDVLISVRAPVGLTNLASEDCIIGRGLAAVRPTTATSTRYLLWVLRATVDQLREKGTGSTFEAVTGNQLGDHVGPLPPPPEQQRIVAAIEEQFSCLDAAEAALQEAIRRLELLRRSAVETWLGARWSIHWTTLADIAEVVGGVTKDSKRQQDPRLVAIPYLRVANVQRGYLDLREIATIRVTPERLKALRLEPGDILFNEGGDRDKLGRGCVWEGPISECIHQNHVFRARLRTGDFDPKFVSLHGNSFGQSWFEKHGKQTTNLASISLTALKAFPVPSLPLSVQRETVARVERVGSLVDSSALAIATGLRRSAGLRRSILERAFTGRLVPQDPSDEPASELVERIRAGRDGTPPRRRRPRRADTVSS